MFAAFEFVFLFLLSSSSSPSFVIRLFERTKTEESEKQEWENTYE